MVLWLSIGGIALNALLSWALIFGHFGLPALGLVGGGVGSTLTWLVLCVALIAVIRRDRQFRRFHLFGRWWRFERRADASRWSVSAGRSALTMALEMGVFALAAYFMGWIGALRGRRACRRSADRGADLHGSARPRTGRDGSRRPRPRTERRCRDHARRLDRLDCRRRLHGRHGASSCGPSRDQLVTLFLTDVPANAAVIALAVSFLKVAAAFQLVDGAQVIGAGMLRGLHDTRWPLIFALVRLLGCRPRNRRLAGLRRRLARASASGSGSPPGLRPSRR